MKIGIMTFHRALNVGAVLQAWALQVALCGLGHDARLVDYGRIGLPPRFRIRLNSFRALCSSVLADIRSLFLEGERRAKYRRFISAHIQTIPCRNKSTLKLLDCDVFLCGSDLVWNPTYNERDDAYFLDFVQGFAKKISYAPSFGDVGNDPIWEKNVARYLSDFAMVSVRESQSAAVYRRITGRVAEIVCDPTFLIPLSAYRDIESPMCGLPKKYVLLYIVCGHPWAERFAKRISEDTTLPVVYYLSGTQISLFSSSQRGSVMNIGPAEFLYLEHHAECVVTNSFHGLVFAILNHKQPFVALNKELGDARMVDLVREVGLSGSIVSESQTVTLTDTVDWNAVDDRIYQMRQKGIGFLKRI